MVELCFNSFLQFLQISSGDMWLDDNFTLDR